MIRWAVLLVVGVIAVGHADDLRYVNGGDVVAPRELPHQVHIDVHGKFKCGGTLITSMHVLTAAHCLHKVVNATSNTVVVTGSVKLSEGQTHRVKAIYSHPQFMPSIKTPHIHDIAIVVLRERIEVTRFQRPIPIATKQTPSGRVVLVSGWGQTKFRGEVSESLLKRSVTLISTTLCQSLSHTIIYPSQMCGLDGREAGFCTGDDGGPLVYENEVIGIASWTFACGRGSPDVYTNVYYYREFIHDIIHRSQVE